MSKSIATIITGLLLAGVIAGCSDGRPQRVPVSGQVFINGQPLRSGGIRFTPEGGRPSSGTIDADGRFTLTTYDPSDGCTLGKHRVSVVSVDQLSSTTRRWNAPKAYASPDSSGLTETIDGPVDSVKIELTWGNEKGPFVEKMYGE
jgi:hypothetical protein